MRRSNRHVPSPEFSEQPGSSSSRKTRFSIRILRSRGKSPRPWRMRLTLILALVAIANGLAGMVGLLWLVAPLSLLVALLTTARDLLADRSDHHLGRQRTGVLLRQRNQQIASLLAEWPLRRVAESDPYRLGIFHSTIADCHQHLGRSAPYVARAHDDVLDASLRAHQPFVLLVGPSKAGKSRSAFEALLRTHPDHWIIAPLAPSVGTLVGTHTGSLNELAHLEPPTEVDPPGPILWLDNAEQYLRSGHLSVATLHRMQIAYPGLVTIATITERELERLSPETEYGVAAVLRAATQLRLESGLTEDERIGAVDLYGEIGSEPQFASAMGEYFAAADQLIHKYRSGREIDPFGVALVRAAADWRRSGMSRAIPEKLLRRIATDYVQERTINVEITDGTFISSLRWALAPVESSAALLVAESSNDERSYGVFDFVEEWVAGHEPPVTETTWQTVESHVRPEDGFSVGLSAWSAKKNRVARSAWTVTAGAPEQPTARGASLNLGLLLLAEGYRAAARALLERAITGPEDEVSVLAFYNMGALLEEEGDLDSALTAYQAAQKGEGKVGALAKQSLARILHGRGDIVGAREAYQGAVETGHPDVAPYAAHTLAHLLERAGDIEGAQTLFQLAIASRDSDLACTCTIDVGTMLRRQGDLQGSRSFLERAVDAAQGTDVAHAAYELGVLLAGQEPQEALVFLIDGGVMADLGRTALPRTPIDRDAAQAAYRRVLATGDPEYAPRAAYNLGLLLQDAEDMDGARAAFESLAILGNPGLTARAAFALGNMSVQAGNAEAARSAYERAMTDGEDDVPANAAMSLAELLRDRGDVDGAKMAYEYAMATNRPPHAFRGALGLGALLEDRGDYEGARAAYEVAIDLESTRATGGGPEELADQLARQVVGGLAPDRMAKLLFREGDTTGAREALRRGLAMSQPSTEAAVLRALRLGQRLDHYGDTDGAQLAYEHALEVGGQDVPGQAAFRLAEIREAAGDMGGSRVAYELAIGSGHPHYAPQAVYRLGMACRNDGRASDAQAVFRQAIGSGNNDQAVGGMVGMAELLSAEGDTAGSEAAYRMAVDVQHAEWSPFAAYRLGALLRAAGELDPAAAAYESVMSFEGSGYVSKASYELGLLLVEMRDTPAAMVAFERAANSDDGDVAPKAYVELGIIQARSRKTRSAGIEMLQRALVSGHDQAVPLAGLKLAWLLFQADTARACTSLRSGLSADGSRRWIPPQSVIMMGVLFLFIGEKDAGLEAFRWLAHSDSPEHRALAEAFMLGISLQAKGDRKSARSAYKLAQRSIAGLGRQGLMKTRVRLFFRATAWIWRGVVLRTDWNH